MEGISSDVRCIGKFLFQMDNNGDKVVDCAFASYSFMALSPVVVSLSYVAGSVFYNHCTMYPASYISILFAGPGYSSYYQTYV
jgi:hypothetical protein